MTRASSPKPPSSLASVTPGQANAAAPGASRAVTVRSWQPDRRQVIIGPGAASYLVMHGNFNSGWDAVLNGHALEPARLDGWQQGFIVPAGTGGTVTLTFRPAATYHLVLAVSLAVASASLVSSVSFKQASSRSRRPK